MDKTQALDALFADVTLLPVISIEREADVLPLADALAAGGITTLEITLRTSLGLPAIELLRRERPQLRIGAGTVTNAAQFQAVEQAGAHFVVTPGITEELLQLGLRSRIPLLPGIATASEILAGYRLGYRRFKVFPAEVLGGAALLRSFAGPFKDVRFCPTGGIGQQNIDQYLALDNLLAVGGSWVTPKAAVAAADWAEITRLSRAATALAAAR
ncbi:MAG: bifunctional 4-hydroxy-2-oxoglutarate aldolase/2-dehydro-3-deoxy-phosphogluconate aldolase [Halopseudomonas sp.]|uniref:bifunctional 4-hydroxy-2-oxoglutarate aldolase/2-dehydro-3-deoxy-phosphogluconate aldolase n=1 Tax=Halopseudomonas sp. TaxID=2901191 RepID=UPI003002E722